ncbi:amino acid permease [bacterium]|nr:amino acid permease [bacterium]MCI0607158.1 amino acid permease [bacterium]
MPLQTTQHEEDVKQLHRLGYAQELARRMSGFSNFAISFSIICILAGGITAFAAGFCATGGASIGIGWPIGSLFALVVALAMGQIASAYPTAGGLYHWGSILGGRAWGWATAWFNLLGLIFVVASVDVGVYLLFRDLLLNGVFGVDPTKFTVTLNFAEFPFDVTQFVFVVIILSTQGLLNHYGIRATTMLTDFSGYLIFAISILLSISLLVYSPVHLDFTRLFTFTNFTGDSGGGVWPNQTSNMLIAFLLGLLLVCYTITGFDASAHTSEETQRAAVNVPRGMWTAVFWSAVFGYLMVCAFVLAMPDVNEGAKTGYGVFAYLMGASRMPDGLRSLLYIGIVLANYLCALAGLTSCSRMMYAFARDGGLPMSGSLSHVNPQHRTPTTAIWISVALILLSCLYAPAFIVLATGCAIFLYISYVMPIAAGFLAEGKSWREKGPFNLGRFSKPIALLAIIGGLILAWVGFQPPNQKVLYLTIGLILFLVVLWFTLEWKRFEGPPTGAKIEARQTQIAAIEADLVVRATRPQS